MNIPWISHEYPINIPFIIINYPINITFSFGGYRNVQGRPQLHQLHLPFCGGRCCRGKCGCSWCGPRCGGRSSSWCGEEARGIGIASGIDGLSMLKPSKKIGNFLWGMWDLMDFPTWSCDFPKRIRAFLWIEPYQNSQFQCIRPSKRILKPRPLVAPLLARPPRRPRRRPRPKPWRPRMRLRWQRVPRWRWVWNESDMEGILTIQCAYSQQQSLLRFNLWT